MPSAKILLAVTLAVVGTVNGAVVSGGAGDCLACVATSGGNYCPSSDICYDASTNAGITCTYLDSAAKCQLNMAKKSNNVACDAINNAKGEQTLTGFTILVADTLKSCTVTLAKDEYFQVTGAANLAIKPWKADASLDTTLTDANAKVEYSAVANAVNKWQFS